MRVVLIDNFFMQQSHGGKRVSFYPHLGLLSIASTLTEGGYTAQILDPKLVYAKLAQPATQEDADECVLAAIMQLEPTVVGFTAYGLTFHHVCVWVRRLKAMSPSTRIILGGPHVSMLPDAVADALPDVDLIAVGEAETYIVEAVDACLNRTLPSLQGARYRNGVLIVGQAREGRILGLETLRIPDLRFYAELPSIDFERFTFPIEAGRGCPYECTFCSTAQFFGRRYRVKPSPQLVGEIERIRAATGISSFDLNHDLFGLNTKSLLEFCRLAEQAGFSWQCSMRPDQMTPGVVGSLAQGGCKDLYLGFETGSASLQSLIKKRLDLREAVRGVERLTAAGLRATCSFITGFPEESVLDLASTLDVIGEILCIDPVRVIVQLHLLSPEPGSEIGKRTDLAFDGIGPDLQPVEHGDLVRRYPEIFANHYYIRTSLGRRLHLLASLFVMRVLPDLGYSFVAFAIARSARRSLGDLFSKITDDIGEFGVSEIEAIRETLTQRFLKLAGNALGDEVLAHEYARFRAAWLYLRDTEDGQEAGAEPNAVSMRPVSRHSRSRFEYRARRDVVAFIAQLEKREPIEDGVGDGPQTWLVTIYRDATGVHARSAAYAENL